MQQLIAYAKSESLNEISDAVLDESYAMLRMCVEFGLTAEKDPSDARLTRVVLTCGETRRAPFGN